MSYISERIHRLNLLHSTSAKLPLCKRPGEQRRIGEELTTNVQSFWWFKHRPLNGTMIWVMNCQISLLQLWFKTAGTNFKKLQTPHYFKKLSTVNFWEGRESKVVRSGVTFSSSPPSLNHVASIEHSAKQTYVNSRSSDTGYWLLKI